jgi:uncharacterized protein YgbK (DUF1537 family)
MILVLADDMTGALEVGAVFAASGFRATVSTQLESGLMPDVLVVDTETRHSTPSAAFERIIHVVKTCAIVPDFVYKKTDSTLRGNIRSELSALAAAFPGWKIGYAPAYPKQGRTVKDGVLYVNGVPLSATVFAHDVLNPVLTSSVRDLVGPELQCAIFDGASELDVNSAAETILADERMRIAAGPTALAAALAAHLQCRNSSARTLPSVKSCVLVNGSRTELSHSQVRHAESHRCVVRCEVDAWVLADPMIESGSEPPAVAAMRAENVISLLSRRPTDGVFVIGGDTAYAFVSALNNPPITPIAEVVPGVAISRIDNSHLRSRLPAYDRDLILITKAGGFGEVDVLCRVRQILEQNAG